MTFNGRKSETALICKKAARKYEEEFNGLWDKENWDNGRKETVMKKGLIFKFKQHPEMLDRLMLTGEALLIEASHRDAYWGGLIPNSKNRLGECLMELRENNRKTQTLFF